VRKKREVGCGTSEKYVQIQKPHPVIPFHNKRREGNKLLLLYSHFCFYATLTNKPLAGPEVAGKKKYKMYL